MTFAAGSGRLACPAGRFISGGIYKTRYPGLRTPIPDCRWNSRACRGRAPLLRIERQRLAYRAGRASRARPAKTPNQVSGPTRQKYIAASDAGRDLGLHAGHSKENLEMVCREIAETNHLAEPVNAEMPHYAGREIDASSRRDQAEDPHQVDRLAERLSCQEYKYADRRGKAV